MSRVFQAITPHRAAQVVSAGTGWAVGTVLVHGGFDTEAMLWAGIAFLGLVQLKLLLPPEGDKQKA